MSTVVVGGGITGLATAWLLQQAGREVVLLEAGDRLGGKIRTRLVAGRRLDVGADALSVREPHARRLVRQLGLGDQLVAPVTERVWLWVDGRMHPMPAGTLFGVPTSLEALTESEVLSPGGAARAAMEPLLPATPRDGDVSVGELVRSRFGEEVLRVLVEPLLGGIYAGPADRLSLEAAAGPIAEAAGRHRSLLMGARALRAERDEDGGPALMSLRGGMDRLVDALARALGDRVRKQTPVVAVEPVVPGDGGSARRRWRVATERTSLPADHVVIATPASVADSLLEGPAPRASELLAEVTYASVATVLLGYHRDEVRGHPRGSGMLVPASEGRLIKAVTWVGAKWPHHRGGERLWLRASVGRIGDTAALALDDDELARRVDAELREAMELAEPADARVVTRWPDALPQYEVGHRERVAAVRDGLPEGIHVAGAAYDGIGITSCVEQAGRVAAHITGG